MAKGLTLDIGADTREFQRGVKDAERALDDVADALDDAARDGDKAADQLERSFSDAQKDISRSARRMGDDIGDESRRGFDRAKNAGVGLRDELKQNFAEVASSFDGSVQGIADGIQGTLGGAALAVGGPLGIALAGLGAIGGSFAQQWADAAAETEERIEAMYDDMLESGQNYLSQEFVNQQIGELVKDQGRYNEILERSKQLGIDVSTLLIAEVTAGQERNQVLERAEELRQEALESAKAGADYTDAEAQSANKLAGELAGTVQHYLDLNGSQSDSLSKVEAARKAQELVNQQFSEGARTTEQIGQNIDSWEELKRVRLEVDAPDPNRIFDNFQRVFSQRTLRLQGAVVTRNGTVVY